MGTTQPLSDLELLERFLEREPDAGNVHRIVATTEAEFVASYAEALDDGAREARRIYAMAQSVSQTTALIWANVRDLVAPHLSETLFNNVAQSFVEHQQAMPGYQSLFGRLSVLDCEDARSVFGPAAYFVDLMRFVDQHVDAGAIRPVHSLSYRRPDLARLVLDARNTYELVPAIELVIEALASIVTATGGRADDVLRSGRYPWRLPIDIPHGRIRAYVDQLGSSLGEIYAAFDTDSAARSRETLGLSPAVYELLAAKPAAPGEIFRAYGGVDLETLISVDTLLDRTGLTRSELTALTHGPYDRAELAAGLARRLFVSDVDDGLGALEVDTDTSTPLNPTERLRNLTPAKLDHIERFVRLARNLDWSFADLSAALRSIRPDAAVETVLHFDGVNDHVSITGATGLDVSSMTIECWVRPAGHGPAPILARGSSGPNAAAVDALVWIDADDRLALYSDSAAGYSRSRRPLPVGSFSHVAVAIGAGARPTVTMIVNGESVAVARVDGSGEKPSNELPAPIGTTGDEVLIGRGFDRRGFSGSITDVRMWRGVRRVDAIADLRFARLSGGEGDLIGYWPLVEERWNRLSDRSPNGNHATFGGSGYVTQPRWIEHDLALEPLPPLVPPTFRFDGVDDLLAADVPTPDLDEFTIELMVRTAGTAGPLLQLGTDVALGIDDGARLTVSGNAGGVTSTNALGADRLVHVAAVIGPSEIAIVIDGVADSQHPNPGIRLSGTTGGMTVGHDRADAYFEGELAELRIWERRLTETEIDRGRHRPAPTRAPGLVGYWPLDAAVDGKALDRSHRAAHLMVGGDPRDQRPERIEHGPILPRNPVTEEATMLELDGANDIVTIDSDDFALGRHDRLTLAMLVQAKQPQRDRPQIVLTQGDGEAGLSLVLADARLHATVWNADYDLTDVAEMSWSGPDVDAEWHHVALTLEERRERTELVVYFDGNEAHRASVPGRLQLSPVGPTHIGGLGRHATTRFLGEYATTGGPAAHFFAGRVAELQLWNRILTADELTRHRLGAPEVAAEALVGYLPLNDASGHLIVDPRTGVSLRGELSRDDIALSSSPVTLEGGASFAHYAADGSAEWSNYEFLGRLRLDENGSGGVTVLSSHPEGRDRCYVFGVTEMGEPFSLWSRPSDVTALDGQLDTGVIPEPGLWYRFALVVSDDGSATTVSAQVWPDGEQRPGAPAAEARDESEYRLTQGTVGLWRSGPGRVHLDDATVAPHLDENFEGHWPSDPGELPDDWSATNVLATAAPEDVFAVIDTGDVIAFGTEADRGVDEELRTRFIAEESPMWSEYIFTGRFRVGQGTAFGLTVLDAGGDHAYRLRRLPHRPSLQLDTRAHEHPLDGRTDSAYEPAPDIWHHFLIEVASEGGATRIRARFWAAGEAEPDGYAIDALDASAERLTQGTVGLWSVGAGVRLVDDILVFPLAVAGEDGEAPRYADDFESYDLGDHPDGWTDSGPDNSDATTTLFTIAEDDGSKVLRSTDTVRNAHSHYTATDALAWTNYVFTGRLLVGAETTGFGVTFFSRYPELLYEDRRDPRAWRQQGWMHRPHNRYYRLGRASRDETFSLWAHPDRDDAPQRGHRDYDRWPMRFDGTIDSGVACELGEWYRFRIRVEDTGTETRITARIWRDGTDEPHRDQIDAVDRSEHRLTSGGIGLWASGRGTRMVDDLAVRPIALLAEDFDQTAIGERPDGWQDEVIASRHNADASLFATHNTMDNPARWSTTDVPVIRRVVGTHVLRFDGIGQHVTGRVRRLDLSGFAIEAWIKPSDVSSANPVLALGSGSSAFVLGLDAGGVPALRGPVSVVGDAAVATGWIHLAAVVGDDAASLLVNGRKVASTDRAEPVRVRRDSVTIGRTDADHFAGDITEVRIWSGPRTFADIARYRYRGFDVVPDELAAYWPVGDGAAEPESLLDRSGGDRHLLLGGGAASRRPSLVPGAWFATRAEDLAPTHVIRFGGPSDALALDLGSANSNQRRTVEIWFRVDDAAVDERRQPLYVEGDDSSGLGIYVRDGKVYAGGWDVPNGWHGSWVESDRVSSGRWHHAALVLDGRLRLRPGALRAYVDGRLVGAAPGAQLSAPPSQAVLGGRADGTEWLEGEIMALRTHDTARRAEEIGADWLRSPADALPDVGDQSRLLALEPDTVPRREPMRLSDEVLAELAAIHTLQQRFGLPLDRLVAHWSPIHQVGRRHGRPLFDRLFNDDSTPQWDRSGIPPVRWDVDAQEDPDRDHRIRSRLMAGLRVSSNALDDVVAVAFSGERIVTLDGSALDRLFRATATPRLLRATAAQTTRLRRLLAIDAIDSPAALEELVARMDWLERHGMTLQEFIAILDGDTAGVVPESEALEEMIAGARRTMSPDAVVAGLAELLDAPPDLVHAALDQPEALLTASDEALQASVAELAAVLRLARIFRLDASELEMVTPVPTVAQLDELARYRERRDDYPDGRTMALADRLGIDHGLLERVAATATASAAGDLAEALAAAVRARGDEAWARAKPVRDDLAVRERDALLAVATRNVTEFYQARDAGDLLSEYLLMDVKVGSEVMTSRLVASIAAVQLYVQRCLLNLEEGITLLPAAAKQWEWFKNYRVWEANRKVFLYPESYIEPELRDTKTPQFRELEQTLMQSDIDDHTVRQALSGYLAGFVELADLSVVGSYRHKPTVGDELLYLVGRTRSKPWRFFVRTLRNGVTWEPWEPVGTTIDSEFVSPVHAFGRLFVFWTEFTKLTEAVDRSVPFWSWINSAKKLVRYPAVVPGGATQKEYEDVVNGRKYVDANGFLYSSTTEERVQVNVDFYRPTVKFAYREFDGTWSAPQSIEGVADKLTEVDHLRPEWQRVAVQRSVELKPAAVAIPPVEFVEPDVLLASRNPDLARSSTVSSTGDMTWEFQLRVVSDLSDADVRGDVTEDKLKKRSLRLVAYTDEYGESSPGKRDAGRTLLSVTLSNDFDPIPPLVTTLESDLRVATTKAAEAQALVTARTDALKAAPDDEKEAAKQRLQEAKDALDTAEAARTAAQEALNAALSTTKWRPKLTLAVGLEDAQGRPVAAVSTAVEYGTWQHVAVVLEHTDGGYRVRLLIDGQQVNTGSVATGKLPVQQLVVVGQPDPPNLNRVDPFSAYLSELRVWDVARSTATIDDARDQRMTGKELGLFHLPLDKPLPGTSMEMKAGKGLRLEKAQPPVARLESTKERIVMFVGETRRLIEDNLSDGGIDLNLDHSGSIDSHDLNLSVTTGSEGRALSLHVTTTRGLSLNDYVSGSSSTLNRFTPHGLQRILDILRQLPNHPLRYLIEAFIKAAYQPPPATNRVLDKLPQARASVIDVGNQPGWYILDTGDESYLLKAHDPMSGDVLPLKTAVERMRFRYDTTPGVADRQPVALFFDDDAALAASNAPPAFAFTRLTSKAAYTLQARLFAGDVEGLLDPMSQHATEADFDGYGVVAERVATRPAPQIDFNGPHGIYYWELFFHVPFLIADKLNADQKFAEAQRWYHFIFDPTAATLTRQEHWAFRPFREALTLPDLRSVLEDAAALAAYRNDPFDPHAIARLRLGAYPKAVLIKYIANLLDWADALFSQDTGESVREATQLYVLASNLLGRKPAERGGVEFEEIGDFATIRSAFAARPAPRRFARDTRGDVRALPAGDQGLPDFLTELVFEPGALAGGATIELVNNGSILTTFCVPENRELLGLWDRVEDRLFKIRHSLNIEGVARQLALFEPPIDPGKLVEAVAGGGGVSGAVDAVSVPVPHYRYSTMLAVAKELADSVANLGGALAGALESRDGERLAALLTTHEQELLGMASAVKDAEIAAAREALEGLKISKRAVVARRDRFAALVDEGLSPEEITELVMLAAAGVVKGTTGVLNALEGVLAAVPDAEAGGSGFGGSPVITIKVGGDQFKAPVKAAIGIAEVIADVLDLSANLVSKRGGWRRRAAEWDHELAIANLDLEQTERQIAEAQIAVENAQRALAMHRRKIAHNRAVAEFHRRKFSNEELYGWMVARLSGLHFQAYRLAHDAARAAERALQYELPTNDTFISFGNWDGLRRGLLAGESLLVDLQRMETHHLSQDSRFLEIEKTIRLSELAPGRLLLLKETGRCEFELPEAMFDADHPGHYFRVIKTIEVSLEAPVGDQETINATLVQLGNKTLLDPDINGVRYLLGDETASEPGGAALRVNWRANQQIAISRVNRDDGMFVLDFFRDDRYFPFEGTGAVSRWLLEIEPDANPNLALADLADVIVHLRYTAKADRGAFRDQVRREVERSR